MTIADSRTFKFNWQSHVFVALIVGLLGLIDLLLQTRLPFGENHISFPHFACIFIISVVICFKARYFWSLTIGFIVFSFFASSIFPSPQLLLLESLSLAICAIAWRILGGRLEWLNGIASIQQFTKVVLLVFVPLSVISPLIRLAFLTSATQQHGYVALTFFIQCLTQLNGYLLLFPLISDWRYSHHAPIHPRSVAISLPFSFIILLLGQAIFFEWFANQIFKPYWLIFLGVLFVLGTRAVRLAFLLSIVIALQAYVSAVLEKGFFTSDLSQYLLLNTNTFIITDTLVLLLVSYFLMDTAILKRDLIEQTNKLDLKAAALAAISQGVVITDENRKITYVNRAFLELTKYREIDLIGNDCRILQGKETNSMTARQIRLALDAKKIVHVDILNYKRDGEKFWNELSISPVFSNGVLTQFVGVQQDISLRKNAEHEAKLAKTVFEHNHSAIVITDHETNIIAINPMFTEITGYVAEEVIGNTPHFLSAGIHDASFYDEMWNDLNTLGVWEGEVINKKKNGEFYPQYLCISRVVDGHQQVLNYIGMFRDLSEEKKSVKEIFDLQHRDHLTGLRNLPSLIETVKSILEQEAENAVPPSQKAALILIDIDSFQNINDTLNHHTGDRVLIKVAEFLKNFSSDTDLLARQGGDEFVFFLSETDSKTAGEFAKNILLQLAIPFELDGHSITLNASAGIAMYPEDGTNFDALLKCADIALNHVKKNGKNNCQLHTTKLSQAFNEKIAIETALESARKNDEFTIFYQPVVDIVTGKICCMEALIRWHHPQLGWVSPVRFIPIAEQSNIISTIGHWVLHQVCRHIRSALDAGIAIPIIAINFSAKQFTNPNLVTEIGEVLDQYQLKSNNLCIEITEGVLMTDPAASQSTLTQLRDLGFCLALDDFGTGYSSLSYLKKFPFDKVKIDQSFVRELTTKNQDAAIINAIINMGHSLGIKVLAEGVETEMQCEFLRDQLIDEIQGYFFSQPLDWEKTLQLLQEDRQLTQHLLRHPPISQTLLLVDDEQNIVSALKRLLRRDGYEILTTNSGADGLEILSKNKVDVIISDQRMPGMTGVEFLSQVRERYPNTIRLVLSGYTELKSVTDAINEGSVFRFLTKPWDDDKLRECVREAFQYKNYADENRKLSLQAQSSNFELAVANRQLAETIEKKQHQLTLHTHSLDIVREALRYTPVAVIGLDDQYMVAFINEAAITLFKQIPLNFGDELLFSLPELSAIVMHSSEATISEFSFCQQKFIVRWFNMGTSFTKGKIVTISEMDNAPKHIANQTSGNS